MPQMTDPTDALVSFQNLLPLGVLQLNECELDSSLRVHRDEPLPGVQRLTYVYIEGDIVTALAVFVTTEALEGRPCLAIGYAVPLEYRGRGRAKKVVRAALAELRNGFSRAGILPIYIEAVVGADNLASQKVAAATLSDAPNAITDELSGKPALQYVLKVDRR